jgi:hypothetical protein
MGAVEASLPQFQAAWMLARQVLKPRLGKYAERYRSGTWNGILGQRSLAFGVLRPDVVV